MLEIKFIDIIKTGQIRVPPDPDNLCRQCVSPPFHLLSQGVPGQVLIFVVRKSLTCNIQQVAGVMDILFVPFTTINRSEMAIIM